MASNTPQHAGSNSNTASLMDRARAYWLPLGSVTLAAGALLIAGLVTAMPKTPAAAALPLSAILVEPEGHDIDRELRHLGLNPSVLVAAGLDATMCASLAARATDHCDAVTYAGLRQAHTAHAVAKAHLQRLQRAFRAGTKSEATQQDLDNAIAAEADARAAIEQKQQALYQAVLEGLDARTIARIESIRSQQGLNYPDYFKVAERTHAQGIALRDAINGVRIDTKLGQEPSDHQQAIIDAQLANPDIAAAKDRYTANLDAVEAAWEGVFQGG